MTETQQAIRALLVETGGNVQAVALRLGVSDEWVRLQAKNLQGAALSTEKSNPAVNPVELALQPFKNALVPSNSQAIAQLRDSLLENLQAEVEDGALEPAEELQLLRLVLDFEVRVLAVAKPAVQLSQSMTVNTYSSTQVLIEKLGALTPAELRGILAGKAPEVIDAAS